MTLIESYSAGPSGPAVRDITIGQSLAEVAQKFPERIALVAGVLDPTMRRQWTYGELLNDALTAANALLQRFQPGDRVVVWAPNIPEWVLLEYGCALAGVVLVTANPALQAEEIAYLLKQSRAVGIFALPECRGNRML